jgi:hypothetical protein
MRIVEKITSALKAPILSVLGHVQIARLNPQGGSLQAIETEIRNAREVLDRIGQFSGQAQPPSVTVPLHEMVEAALRIVEGALLRGSIKITREIPVDLAIKCDIDEFRTALAAVIRNSIESMEKSLRKNLLLRARVENGQVIFEIQDSGEGILPENVQRIFEPFFTTRSTMDHRGLGLSMAQGVFRQHGAEVQVKSKVGDGTTILLRIPRSLEVVQSLSDRGIPTRVVREHSTPSLEALEKAAVNSPETESLAHQTSGLELKGPVDEVHEFAGRSLFTGTPSGSGLGNLDFFEDDDDANGDFQFGRIDFSEVRGDNPLALKSYESGGEKMAQNVLDAVIAESSTNPKSAAGPSRRLKKKDEPLANIKVQIPRPEEKL